jgi:hypothetical protein
MADHFRDARALFGVNLGLIQRRKKRNEDVDAMVMWNLNQGLRSLAMALADEADAAREALDKMRKSLDHRR